MNIAPSSTISHRDMRFEADGEILAGTFIISDTQPKKNRILFLHGAGEAVRQRIFYLADHLALRGHDSFCIDFSGHGESTGTMRDSSLARRHHQASAALAAAGYPAPSIIFGNSMGGYVAAEMASNPSVRTLVLICPALYATEAYALPFNEKFTTVLRQPGSFRDAHLLDILRAFTGRVLLLIGSEDKVIPEEVMDIYKNAFQRAEKCQYTIIPGAPHKIHLWAVEKPENSQKIFDVIDAFLT